MRLIVLMSALVIVSLLVFKGYSAGGFGESNQSAQDFKADAVERAEDVNRLVQDTAKQQREALQKQLGQ